MDNFKSLDIVKMVFYSYEEEHGKIVFCENGEDKLKRICDLVDIICNSNDCTGSYCEINKNDFSLLIGFSCNAFSDYEIRNEFKEIVDISDYVDTEVNDEGYTEITFEFASIIKGINE